MSPIEEDYVLDRDTIFIGHATPDDNDFVRWLRNELTSALA